MFSLFSILSLAYLAAPKSPFDFKMYRGFFVATAVDHQKYFRHYYGNKSIDDQIAASYSMWNDKFIFSSLRHLLEHLRNLKWESGELHVLNTLRHEDCIL